MAYPELHRVIQHLRNVAIRQHGEGLADSELLDAYVNRADRNAFEVLVRRHGPMVLGVCRRILRNEADAEDAFQATFLVLVRKARSIRPRAMVSNWLFGVARNTALKAKGMTQKRQAKEKQAAALLKAEAAEEVWRQLQTMLDHELGQLPDKYRVPVILCALEGKTIKEAARNLGLPQGTVATRLSKGRSLLAARLSKHGFTISAGALAAALTQSAAAACVPVPLVSSTLKAVSAWSAGQMAAGVISAKVAALTEGVLKVMLITKYKVVAAILSVVVASTVLLAERQAAVEEARTQLAQTKSAEAALRRDQLRDTSPQEPQKAAKPLQAPLAEKTVEERIQGGKPIYQELTTETLQTISLQGVGINQTLRLTFVTEWTPKKKEGKDWIVEQEIIGMKMDITIGRNQVIWDSTAKTTPPVNRLTDFLKLLVGPKFILTIGEDLKVKHVEGLKQFIDMVNKGNDNLSKANPLPKININSQLKSMLSDEAINQMFDPTYAVFPPIIDQVGWHCKITKKYSVENPLPK
jgi:RNA polymerase sigma factor (sigma-70 family)